MNELARLAAEVGEFCSSRSWRFCVIGGFAVQHWGEPLLLAESYGFRSGQLREIRELIEENTETIKAKWNEHIERHRKAQS